MGTTLKILGIIFVLLIVGFVALLIWSHQKGEAVQEDFFEAVLSEEPSRVVTMFHPELREQIDEPLLAIWMASIKEHLGAFDGLAKTAFSTSTKTENGVTVVESKGKVKFEKGEAVSELKLVDGKIKTVRVTSDALPDPWLQSLPDTTPYVEKGKDCLEKLLTDRVDEAATLMHESLLQEMPPDQMKTGMVDFRRKVGDLVSIEEIDHEFVTGETPELRIRYEVTCERGPVAGSIKFQFTPWKAHLVAFNMKQGQ